MDEVDHYETLYNSKGGRIEVNGNVLLAESNGSKVHLCKSTGTDVAYRCGSGTPTNPHSSAPGWRDPDYYEKRFRKSADSVPKRRALEGEDLCRNCKKHLQSDLLLERIILTIDPNEDIEETMEYVEERIEEARQ